MNTNNHTHLSNNIPLTQAQVASQRAGFRGNALLQTAVAAYHVGKVVYNGHVVAVEVGCQVLLCHRHAHCIADACVHM